MPVQQVIEVAGFVCMIRCAFRGWLAFPEAMIFLGLAICLGVLLSTSAIMLEELYLHMYPKLSQVAMLYFIAIVENFGFRQLTALWRLQGLVRSLSGREHKWETIARSASLATKDVDSEPGAVRTFAFEYDQEPANEDVTHPEEPAPAPARRAGSR